jgi:exodeoxyribonuclease VII large subunit
MDSIDISHSAEIYTVSRLNREVRFLLEDSFPLMWIEGEISNFSAPHSGHWYFSLKDALAQVKCAMFKTQNRKLNFTPKDGMQVLIKARISLYEGRGDFQLLVEHLEEAGEGKLRQEFEILKKRLLAAGLFDTAHKKRLPALPKTIGVITSPSGAAIRDILSVLKRRFCCAKIIIYPTLVQGETAAPTIVDAIQLANRRNECDVLILARGGGSLEDLWPFNEEIVAHAIYQSKLPVISGVGHEVDFTIADFVADMRAPTPSAAAELISPHIDELQESLLQNKKHFNRLIKQTLEKYQQSLSWLNKHLQQQHPKRRLNEQAQQLDRFEISLFHIFNRLLQRRQTTLKTLRIQLLSLNPIFKIQKLNQQLNHDLKIIKNSMSKQLQYKQQILAHSAGKLDALSPLATLKRGYAIAYTASHEVLRFATEVKTGDNIQIKLMEGMLSCKVKEIN